MYSSRSVDQIMVNQAPWFPIFGMRPWWPVTAGVFEYASAQQQHLLRVFWGWTHVWEGYSIDWSQWLMQCSPEGLNDVGGNVCAPALWDGIPCQGDTVLRDVSDQRLGRGTREQAWLWRLNIYWGSFFLMGGKNAITFNWNPSAVDTLNILI